MHRPIEDGLERYLKGGDRPEDLAEFHRHLAACTACRESVARMEQQARLLRALRPPEDVTAAPGFYARVLDRIESQRSRSGWYAFLEPALTRRIAYASLALILLLGLSMMSSDPFIELTPSSPEAILASEDIGEPVVIGVGQDQDRESILVNLVTHQE